MVRTSTNVYGIDADVLVTCTLHDGHTDEYFHSIHIGSTATLFAEGRGAEETANLLAFLDRMASIRDQVRSEVARRMAGVG